MAIHQWKNNNPRTIHQWKNNNPRTIHQWKNNPRTIHQWKNNNPRTIHQWKNNPRTIHQWKNNNPRTIHQWKNNNPRTIHQWKKMKIQGQLTSKMITHGQLFTSNRHPVTVSNECVSEQFKTKRISHSNTYLLCQWLMFWGFLSFVWWWSVW